MPNLKIILIVHNIRSSHNVGSLLRSADGLGVEKVYLTGYTPYPEARNDKRLPHVKLKLSQQIHKTALGAEKSVKWGQRDEIYGLLDELRRKKLLIVALEQTPSASSLMDFKTSQNLALIVGNEIDGLDKKITELSDVQLQIPMLGSKESFNVAIAGAIALYHLKHLA